MCRELKRQKITQKNRRYVAVNLPGRAGAKIPRIIEEKSEEYRARKAGFFRWNGAFIWFD